MSYGNPPTIQSLENVTIPKETDFLEVKKAHLWGNPSPLCCTGPHPDVSPASDKAVSSDAFSQTVPVHFLLWLINLSQHASFSFLFPCQHYLKSFINTSKQITLEFFNRNMLKWNYSYFPSEFFENIYSWHIWMLNMHLTRKIIFPDSVT